MRIEMASMPWGWVTDTAGNGINGVTVTLNNLDGTAATHYSAITAGSSSTGTLTTNSDGTIPRYIRGGTYLMTVLGVTRRVDAVPGNVGAAFDYTGSHTLYASTTGSDSNDGLSSGSPKTFQGALTALQDYGPMLAGTWTIQLAAGTYTGAPYALADNVLSGDVRLTIQGPAVGGHPNVPTAIINAAGAGNGLIIGANAYVLVQDVKVINAATADSGTAAGILFNTGCDAYAKNCHPGGNAGYAGIYFNACKRARVSGGVWSGTQQYGTVYYNTNPFTHGYASTTTADSPSTPAGTVTLASVLCQSSYGDGFNLSIDGVPIGVLCAARGRFRCEGSSIINCTTAAVKGQGAGCEIGIYGQSPANTLTGNTSNIILLGGATEFSIHSSSSATSEVMHYRATTGTTLTGTLTATPLMSAILADILNDTEKFTYIIGKRVKITAWGTFTGTAGTKAVGVRFLSTDMGTVTFPAGANGGWRIQGEILMNALAVQIAHVHGIEYVLSTPGGARQSRTITLTGAQSFRIYGTLGNTGDSIVPEGVEASIS